MSQGTNQSYLDLSVHPSLAPFVLSHDPVVVFSGALDSILWANAPGAALFGGKGVIELLEANVNESQAFVRQLKDAVRQMKSANKIIRGFRINQGLRSALLQFEITGIGLDDSNLVYRVKCEALDDKEPSENELAKQAVGALESFADASAIVDDYGLPIASSGPFGKIGPSEEQLLELIRELQDEEDQLIKRPIQGSGGNRTIAGLGRFCKDPGRTLIVLAEMDEPEQPAVSPSTSMVLLEEADQDVDQLANENAEETGISPDTVSAEHIPETTADETSRQDLSTTSSEDEQSQRLSPSERSDDELTPQVASPQEPETENDPSRNHSPLPETAEETDESAAGEETVRFAWTTDADGIFSNVSKELGKTVGPNAASITGSNWQEIAERFSLDEYGDVAAAFEKRDTWSGKTVLWPIEGTDMTVPIDLAALPIFDADRQFGGFKGFGIIRSFDAIVDAQGRGLKLIPNKDDGNSTSEDVVSLSQVQKVQEEPTSGNDKDRKTDAPIQGTNKTEDDNLVRISGNLSDDKTGKTKPAAEVVRLVPRKDKQTPALSQAEDSAFRKIAETLRNDKVSKSREQRKADTSLIEKLPVAIFVYRAGEPLFANAKFLEATGYGDLKELSDAGGFESLFDHDENNGSNSTGLIMKTGEIIPISPILHKVTWAGESALQLSFPPPVQVEDTSTPPAIELTQVSEIQSILDTTSDGIILLKDDGEILSVNASAEALFDTTFDDAVGQKLSTLFAPESKREIEEYIESISQPGIRGVFQKGLDTIGKVGSEGIIPIYLTVARLETSGKLCAVVRDLSTWKKTEQELIRSRRDAERASEEKSEFLAKVSHEIRTPLNAIIGFSDLMIEQRFGVIENKRYREYLQDINRSGKHVLELVNDLLDLSKIESGKLDLEFAAVDLNAIATECVALMQPNANANRIIIRTSLSRSVPKVVADERSIKQIIINLLSNAIKYSPASSQVIVSTVYEDSGEVALRIRDAGSGMNDEEIVEALKPYSRLRGSHVTNEVGTGLGLSLTKALVEANRAVFGLESEPDVGTIAHVLFPVQRVLTE